MSKHGQYLDRLVGVELKEFSDKKNQPLCIPQLKYLQMGCSQLSHIKIVAYWLTAIVLEKLPALVYLDIHGNSLCQVTLKHCGI